MHPAIASAVWAAEGAAEHAEGVSPYAIGGLAFGTLIVLLIITMMIKVEPKGRRD